MRFRIFQLRIFYAGSQFADVTLPPCPPAPLKSTDASTASKVLLTVLMWDAIGKICSLHYYPLADRPEAGTRRVATKSPLWRNNPVTAQNATITSFAMSSFITTMFVHTVHFKCSLSHFRLSSEYTTFGFSTPPFPVIHHIQMAMNSQQQH